MHLLYILLNIFHITPLGELSEKIVLKYKIMFSRHTGSIPEQGMVFPYSSVLLTLEGCSGLCRMEQNLAKNLGVCLFNLLYSS